MTPVWVFPAYPLLLTAPFGSNLIAAAIKSGQLESLNTVAVAVASVAVQGTGFLISFMICSAFIYRLMTQKLPRDAQRPGVFISIGPGGFTAAGIVTLGSQTGDIFPADFMGTEHAIFILRLLSYMAGLWLWGLSIWFFLVSVGSLWKYVKPENRSKMPFQMTWFSFVFPNTALVRPPADRLSVHLVSCAF
jgi:tellurite resistance protein TehA-like permease